MRLCVSLALLISSALFAQAGDWPQWLGPNRDGSSAEKIAPWKGDLKIQWRTAVGEGHSSPIVSEGLVFLHTKVTGKEQEILQAFDAKTGDKKWEQAYEKPSFTTPFGNGPRGTPCIHDGKIYAFGITGTLACFDAATGKPLWSEKVLEDPKAHNLLFGVSASPLVVGENVVVQGGNAKGSKGVKAYDLKTGKLAWTAGEDPASYAAPALLDKNIVVLTGANLVSVSPKGEIRWKYPFKDALNESSTTPIMSGDLFLAGSVTAGSVALKEAEKDGKPQAVQAWKNAKLTCYFSTPVAVSKDHYYIVTGSIPIPAATLRCVETASGKVVWSKTGVGTYHAALLKLADGNLLMHDDKTGNLTLLAPNVKEYQELAKSKAGGSTWAHPAIADGKVYIRDNKELICLALGGN